MEGRRTEYRVAFDGADITEDIRPFFLSLTYVDSEDGAADDLSLKLQDRDGLWMEHWLEKAVQAAAGAKLKIACAITRRGWEDTDETLESGSLELDSVTAKGPPSVVTIKATGLGFSSTIRQVKRSRAWENCTLKTIATQIAANGATTCMFEARNDPKYTRIEQDDESDIAFLERLCKDAGLALKCTDGMIVIFDQAEYEAQEPCMVITKGCGYLDYTLKSGTAKTKYDSCRVRYWDSTAGQMIEGKAYAEDYDAEDADNQQLEITARVGSVAEANELAAKKLKLHNMFARTATFTFPGNPQLMAGRTVWLDGAGGWKGKYMISEAAHTVDSGGYVTKVTLRKVRDGREEPPADGVKNMATYTVKRGDNLWKIAKAYYGSGVLWQRIYEANRDVIGKNPNLIYPGQVFTIP